MSTLELEGSSVLVQVEDIAVENLAMDLEDMFGWRTWRSRVKNKYFEDMAIEM